MGEMISDSVKRRVLFGDEGWVGHPEVPVTESVLTGHEGHSGGGAEGIGVEGFEARAL